MPGPFELPTPLPFPGDDLPSLGTFNGQTTAHADRSNWLRRVKLIVADNSGDGLDLSGLTIDFTVTGATKQTLKSLNVRVYNLRDEHAKLIQDEFTQVSLSVGYQGRNSSTAPQQQTAGLTGTFETDPPMTTIFSGLVSYVRRGREDALNSFIDIEAADGDAAFTWSWGNYSMAAGWTVDQQRQNLLNALSKYKITEGARPRVDLNPMPRGQVMYGATRDQLREFALATGADWHFEDDQLHLVPTDGWLGTDAIDVNTGTGMIGSPEQTLEGLRVRTLLNGSLKTGYLVHVQTADITTTSIDANTPLINHQGEPLYMPDLSKSGYYKIYHVTHSGGTRQNDWFSECICRAIDFTQGRDIRSATWLESLVNGE